MSLAGPVLVEKPCTRKALDRHTSSLHCRATVPSKALGLLLTLYAGRGYRRPQPWYVGACLHSLYSPNGQDHELLHSQGVAGVAAAVDDVERGHGQDLSRGGRWAGCTRVSQGQPIQISRTM